MLLPEELCKSDVTIKPRDWRNLIINADSLLVLRFPLSQEVISDDEEERFFRFDLDGQKAKFKLTKREWELIDIKEFPSGGRLLGGAWTTIFKRGIRNSNPWCSLRFKNNHVRAANSRKMNSAPFFRGAGECKREECNMKLKLTIQEEKGKFVMVTYTGNVCHKVSLRNDDEVKPKKSK